MVNFRRIRTDILAFSLLAVTLFVALSLFTYDPADPPSQRFFPARTEVANLCGSTGAQLAFYSHKVIGWGSYFLLFAMFAAVVRLFAREQMPDRVLRVTGWIFSLSAICVALHLLLPSLGNMSVMGSGGYMGAAGSTLLKSYFSMVGTLILIAAFFMSGVLLSDETYLVRIGLGALFAPAQMLKRFADARNSSSVRINFGEANEATEENEELNNEQIDQPTSKLRRSVKINPPVGTGGKSSLKKKSA